MEKVLPLAADHISVASAPPEGAPVPLDATKPKENFERDRFFYLSEPKKTKRALIKLFYGGAKTQPPLLLSLHSNDFLVLKKFLYAIRGLRPT